LTLEEYYKKRNFNKSPEPKGDEKNPEGSKIFVIQKHDASHLHYDLRLEIEGVLKSWAVPKTPPEEMGIKRLAVQTEDHPLEYAGFEGKIPEGQYGAGTVEIWDKGKFLPEKIKDDEIIFELQGKKMRGKFVLIRLKDRKNWLFFKKK
jgi:DNA ligase D-like protein (predicted 3'-phosphoesterase)